MRQITGKERDMEYRITAPLDKDAVKKLRAGDYVWITGTV